MSDYFMALRIGKEHLRLIGHSDSWWEDLHTVMVLKSYLFGIQPPQPESGGRG